MKQGAAVPAALITVAASKQGEGSHPSIRHVPTPSRPQTHTTHRHKHTCATVYMYRWPMALVPPHRTLHNKTDSMHHRITQATAQSPGRTPQQATHIKALITIVHSGENIADKIRLRDCINRPGTSRSARPHKPPEYSLYQRSRTTPSLHILHILANTRYSCGASQQNWPQTRQNESSLNVKRPSAGVPSHSCDTAAQFIYHLTTVYMENTH